MSSQQRLRNRTKRLSVFECLSQGKPICENRLLPHIIKDRAVLDKSSNKDSGITTTYSSQQERCWMALLLHPTSPLEQNEWEIVREHFENSRSKKVLSIIQQ